MPESPPLAIKALVSSGGKQGSFLENAPRAPGKAPRRFPNGRTAYPCQARARPQNPERAGPLGAREARRQDSGRGLGGKTKTQGVEMGHMQGTAAQIGPVAFALGAGSRNMAERIGARIAKLGSVFGAAAANRIENEEERAGNVWAYCSKLRQPRP